MHKIMSITLLTINSLVAMEPAVSRDPRIAEVVGEIVELTRPKHEAMASLLHHAPFPEQVSHEDFKQLRKVCKPHYAPLLDRLLSAKILSPNTYCLMADCRGIRNDWRVSLLFEAMSCVHNPLNIKTLAPQAYAAILALAKHGANLEQEAQSYAMAEGGWSYHQLPLVWSLNDPQLVAGLLRGGGESKWLQFCG